jgi:hypothetical protein
MTAAERDARALGGGRRSGQWWRSPCPVHRSKGSILALRDGNPKLIVLCHAGGDPRDMIPELRPMPRARR